MSFSEFKTLLWSLLTVPIIATLYFAVISDGLRQLMPVFGTRLHKLPVPGFAMLKRYEGPHMLDLAHVMSLLLMMATGYLLVKMLTVACAEQDYFANSKWEPTTYKFIVMVLGFVIVSSDAVLFHAGMLDQGWGHESVFSFKALATTVAYIGGLTFVAFVTVNLLSQKKEIVK